MDNKLNCQTEHYLMIDIVRGMAALAVVIWHYQHFYYYFPYIHPQPIELNRSIQPLYNLLWPFYNHGRMAAQLFWTISGFVFWHVYAGRAYFSGKSFIIHRLARLYPLHFITLVFVMILQFLCRKFLGHDELVTHNDGYHFFLQLFFASNWGFENGDSFNSVIWSVSVEILAYALFFILMFFKKHQTRFICPLLFLSIMGSVLTRNNILLCISFFLAGGLIYNLSLVLRAWSVWHSVLCAVTAVCCGMLVFVISKKYFLYAYDEFYYNLVFKFSVFPSLVLLLAVIERLDVSKYLIRVRWIGDITYSTYLWHFPMQIALLLWLDTAIGSRAVIQHEWFFVAFVASVIGVGLGSYQMIELPAKKAVSRFLHRLLAASVTSQNG